MNTKKMRKVFSVCGALICLMLVSPFLTVNAQEKTGKVKKTAKVKKIKEPLTQEETKAKALKREEALVVVKENVIANLLYQNIRLKENALNLDFASIYGNEPKPLITVGLNKGLPKQSTVLRFSIDDLEILIRIEEYDSIKTLKERFKVWLSCAAKVEKYDVYGDEGTKNHGCSSENPRPPSINFRRGNFDVVVDSEDEKTTERFAGYVAEAIEGFAIKE